MKIQKSIIAVTIFCLSFIMTKAQVEITPFGGYIFDASFGIQNGKATFLASPAYGINIYVPFKYNEGGFDITYQRQDTKISVRSTDNPSLAYTDSIKVAVNYILVGGVYEFSNSKKIVPYGGINLGLGIIGSKEESDNIVPFSFGFKAGLKLFASQRIGFRIQSELNLMMLLEGSGMGCAVSTSSGTNCGFVITSTASLGQFGLTGGLIFKLQKKKQETKPQIGL